MIARNQSPYSVMFVMLVLLGIAAGCSGPLFLEREDPTSSPVIQKVEAPRAVSTTPAPTPTLREASCIDWKDAASHIAENRCVRGIVYGTFPDQRRGPDYPSFFIFFDPSSQSAYGLTSGFYAESMITIEGLVGQCVEISGYIESNRYGPLIRILNREQVTSCTLGMALTDSASVQTGSATPIPTATFPPTSVPPKRLAITFMSNRDGYWHRYRMNTDGTGLAQLTRGPYDDPMPPVVSQPSPDGQYSLDEVSVGNNRRVITLRSIATGTSQTLTDASYNSWNPTWSPDGNKIVFASTKDGNARIYVMDRDASNMLPITQAWAQAPSWSTDGQWIAYVQQDSSIWNLYRIHPDGTASKMIAQNVFSDGWAPWSPDSTIVAFIGLAGTNGRHIFVINSDGTGMRQLTYGPGEEIGPAWELVPQEALGASNASPTPGGISPIFPTPLIPAVYVTNLVWNPPAPHAMDEVGFTVTFLNTTGTVQHFVWFVSVFVETQRNRFGQTARHEDLFPPGQTVLTTYSTWHLGKARPCTKTWFIVNLADDTGEPAFTALNLQPYRSQPIEICP